MLAPESVVTFEQPDGFRVVRSLGKVHGESICPRNLLRATFRSIGAFVGLGPMEYLTDAERARAQCLAMLMDNARQLGANGVVALRFDVAEQPDGSTRVAASGDAVVLEPDPGTDAA